MKKLTQKQYFEDLQCCSQFCGAYHFDSEESLNVGLAHIQNKTTYKDWKNSCVYNFTSVIKRSKDFVFKKVTDESVYRDFIGKNTYYTDRQILLHATEYGEGE